MKIAVLGAGFTGLTATLKLLQLGHEITLIEKGPRVGGLTAGFKNPGWDWYLDKTYHHLFADDNFAKNLAKEVGQKFIEGSPRTDIYIKGQILPLDSPVSLFTFPYLSPIDKFRTGAILTYFKLLANYQSLEDKLALPWIRKFMGKNSADLLWDPLFTGKFGKYKEEIALTWFWARIKKRSPNLFYPEGGFQEFAEKIAQKIEKLGGKIHLKTEVTLIKSLTNKILLSSKAKPQGFNLKFDIVVSTLPTPIFTSITSDLPQKYTKRIDSIPHLTSLNLVLILQQPFFQDGTYWLNINDPNFPFLVLAEQTNFMDPKYYGNQHILYIGNYLPENHPYLKMSAKELFRVYKPFLQKISPLSPLFPLSSHLFSHPFAQPVVTVNYPKLMPSFHTPLKNVYLANLDMVYPWDRGVNYAIEMGEKVADFIHE